MACSASMDALHANRTWPPSRSHGTYQHGAITSRSRQLLMMGTWLPETCWVTIRREIKNTKSDILLVFLIHTELRCTVNHTSDSYRPSTQNVISIIAYLQDVSLETEQQHVTKSSMPSSITDIYFNIISSIQTYLNITLCGNYNCPIISINLVYFFF
jgi:hypothetical protein